MVRAHRFEPLEPVMALRQGTGATVGSNGGGHDPIGSERPGAKTHTSGSAREMAALREGGGIGFSVNRLGMWRRLLLLHHQSSGRNCEVPKRRNSAHALGAAVHIELDRSHLPSIFTKSGTINPAMARLAVDSGLVRNAAAKSHGW